MVEKSVEVVSTTFFFQGFYTLYIKGALFIWVPYVVLKAELEL